MQLPPINSDSSPWAVVGEHDYELTEILRSDAPDVLDLAHRLRDGKWKPDMVNAHPTRAHGQVNPHDYGAVIVHKNTDRWRLIEQMRGGLHAPQAGDEIMSLANDMTADVVNGQPFKVLAHVETITVPRRVTNTKAGTRVVDAYDYHVLDVEGDDGKARRINVLALGFTGGKKNETTAAKLKRSHKRRRIIPATFGRVLTAHKAQGSEWDRALVAVDLDSLREVMGPSHAARWLYTAVTRARHQVAVATPDQVDGLG
jgi:exodeoxyribonuclease-5